MFLLQIRRTRLLCCSKIRNSTKTIDGDPSPAMVYTNSKQAAKLLCTHINLPCWATESSSHPSCAPTFRKSLLLSFMFWSRPWDHTKFSKWLQQIIMISVVRRNDKTPFASCHGPDISFMLLNTAQNHTIRIYEICFFPKRNSCNRPLEFTNHHCYCTSSLQPTRPSTLLQISSRSCDESSGPSRLHFLGSILLKSICKGVHVFFFPPKSYAGHKHGSLVRHRV
jgi:hypothetical protein